MSLRDDKTLCQDESSSKNCMLFKIRLSVEIFFRIIVLRISFQSCYLGTFYLKIYGFVVYNQ